MRISGPHCDKDLIDERVLLRIREGLAADSDE